MDHVCRNLGCTVRGAGRFRRYGDGMITRSIAFACALILPYSAVCANGHAPVGYALFCAMNRSECLPSPDITIAADAQTMGVINRINRAVNASIMPKTEKVEKWTLEPKSGDCEDYAITKRHRLIRAGIPAGSLRIAVVTIPSGERHAILIVRTNVGNLAMDNLTGKIKEFSSTGYRMTWMASSNPMIGE